MVTRYWVRIVKFLQRVRHGLRWRAQRAFGRLMVGITRVGPAILRRTAYVTHLHAYAYEDHSQVTLCTDDPNLFPGYTPRYGMARGPHQSLKISLITTLKDAAHDIEHWLADLESQSRLPDEVLLVDGGSRDGTMEILDDFQQRTALDLKVQVCEGANIAQGRNIAIQQARYPIIVTADLGCRLPKYWLERLTLPFTFNPALEVVAGWYEPWAQTTLGRWAMWEFVPALHQISPQSFLPSARSMAFRRDAWQSVGGFPEWLSLTGEDTYFALELKRQTKHWAFVPEASVIWQAPETIGEIWRKLTLWSSGDGESGAYAPMYWRRIQLLILGFLSALIGLGITIVLFHLWSLAGWVWISLVGIFIILGNFAVRARTQCRWINLPWRLVGQIARAVGFLQGIQRRPRVISRKHAASAEVTLVLAGVPIHDSGGGSRGAQLAQQFLARDHLVVYVHRFPSYESVDLGISIRHPQLIHCAYDLLDIRSFLWEFAPLLMEKPTTALIEFPLREYLPLAQAIRDLDGIVVYDLIDNWDSSLGGRWYSPEVEQAYIDLSQIHVASAPILVDRLRSKGATAPLLLPNAVNHRLFNLTREHTRPMDMPSGLFTMIYTGALWGDWFDWSLLVEVAKAYPQAAIVIVGDYQDQCPVSLPNLHFLGLKPQTSLPDYLAHADLAIIPWKQDEITRATSPLKVYEFLAMGLPVVAPPLETLDGHPYVLKAQDREEFVRQISKARQLYLNTKELEAFLLSHSWEARLAALTSAITARRSRRK